MTPVERTTKLASEMVMKGDCRNAVGTRRSRMPTIRGSMIFLRLVLFLFLFRRRFLYRRRLLFLLLLLVLLFFLLL